MKLANLADGKMIGFPDDAEDDHMDAAIQAYHVALGKAPPPTDPGLAALQQGFEVLMQGIQQLSQHLAGQIEQMNQQVAQMHQQATGLSEQLADMRAHDEHANQQVVAALTAPKRIVHDENGRPVGVTVGK